MGFGTIIARLPALLVLTFYVHAFSYAFLKLVEWFPLRDEVKMLYQLRLRIILLFHEAFNLKYSRFTLAY